MAACYKLANNTVTIWEGQQKCGPSTSGAQFCCSSDDTCLEDSICHFTHSQVGGSGYYVGACTDRSFPEPCSKSCYASLSLWACCYQHLGASLDCSNPGNETFYAPSPESLTRQAVSSSTTSSSAISSTNGSFTPSSTPSASASASVSTFTSSTSSPTIPVSIPPSSATTTHAHFSALSAGGRVGIGVAASIAGLGIILLLGFFLLRKRRPRQYQEAPINGSNEMTSAPMLEQRHAVEKTSEQQWELNGNARSKLQA